MKRLWGILLAVALVVNIWPATTAFAAEFENEQTESFEENDDSEEVIIEETELEDEDVDDLVTENLVSEELILEDDSLIESEDETESVDSAELIAEKKIADNTAAVEEGFVVSFEGFEGGKIIAYDRQNLDEAVAYEDATSAIARDSDTGEVDMSGSGQVNFSVVIEDGYKLSNVSVTEGTENFKNLKTISEEGNVFTYRITKITGNLTVTVETIKLDDAGQRAVLIEELKKAISSCPRYYKTYCTQETADALKAVLDTVNAYDLETVATEEIEAAINSVNEAVASLEYKTSDVPQIYVSTENGKGNSLVKATGYVGTSIVIADGGNTFTDEGASIKVRGNTTALGEKKPFNVKLSSKQDLFGMGSAKKWCLLANCFDPSLMRNYTALYLAKEMGIPYTSENCFVDLWLDGVYKGNYLLTEAVEAGKTRVDIDVKGGEFILEYEKVREEEDATYIENANGVRFSFKEPEEPSEAQYNNVKEALDRITAIIDGGNYSEVENAIDVESFAKLFVLNEYMKTIDFRFSSVYFFYKDGKLYAGPAWDFDLSSGNGKDNSSQQRSPEGVWTTTANLYPYLLKYDEFHKDVERVLDQYAGLLENIGANGGFIDNTYATYKASFERNFNEAGWDVSKKYSNNMMTPLGTLDENVNYLKNFLYNRYIWMKEYYRTSESLVITKQPSNIVVSKANENAVFTVEATGTDLKYMWFYKAPGSEKFAKTGVNTAEFTIRMYQKNDGIQAYCVITDADGKKVTTDTATASIAKEFAIVKDTEDVTANKNGVKCTFKIEAVGDGIAYSWYYKLTEKAGGDGKFHKAGCFSGEYTVTTSDRTDGIQVYCVVTDSYGNKLVGRTATLSVVKGQVSISYPNGKELMVASGKKASFKVAVTGDDVTYSWYYMISELSGGDGKFHKAGCYADEYVRTASSKTDGMQTYCVITDSKGNKVKSDVITLTLLK